MKKLKTICEKYGIQFHEENFGYRYFSGISPLIVNGAYVCTDNTSGENWRKFIRYCKRYGYTLKYHKFTDIFVYTVCRNDDSEKLALYSEYLQKSVNECEIAIHNRHIGIITESDYDFNVRLSGIMQKYENAYCAAQKASKAA